MIPDVYKIQYSSVFILFLGWLLTNLASQLTSFRSSKAEDSEANNGASQENSSGLLSRISGTEKLFKEGFIFLGLVLIFNSAMLGNKVSTDTFSLIALFSIVFASIGELFGLRIVSKGFWILFLISLISIFVTGLATPGYIWNPTALNTPTTSGSTNGNNFDPNNFNINDFLPKSG